MARRETYDSQVPWNRILKQVSKYFFSMLALGIILAIIVGGANSAVSFTTGALLVYICFVIGIVVVIVAGRRSMAGAVRALMLAYVVKVTVLGIVLLAVPVPDEIKNNWLAVGALTAVVVWLSVEMQTVMNMRILYFDVHDGSSSVEAKVSETDETR